MEAKFTMADEPFDNYENNGANLTNAQKAAQFVSYANSKEFVESSSIEELEKKLFGLVRHHNID